MSPTTLKSSGSTWRAQGRRHVVSSSALLTLLLVAGAIMQAPEASATAPRPGLKAVGPAPVASSPLCSAVGAKAVSEAVGYTVPAATTTIDRRMFSAKYNISATMTDCTYGSQASLADILKDVNLVYEKLSRRVPASVIKDDLTQVSAKAQQHIVAVPIGGFSGSAYYVTIQESTVYSEAIVDLTGVKVAGAVVTQRLPKRAIISLEELAVANF